MKKNEKKKHHFWQPFWILPPFWIFIRKWKCLKSILYIHLYIRGNLYLPCINWDKLMGGFQKFSFSFIFFNCLPQIKTFCTGRFFGDFYYVIKDTRNIVHTKIILYTPLVVCVGVSSICSCKTRKKMRKIVILAAILDFSAILDFFFENENV